MAVEYTLWTNCFGKTRKLLPDRKFDRKTFDPFNNDTDKAILNSLRIPGRTRFNRGWTTPSLRALQTEGLARSIFTGVTDPNKGERFIDFGRGESGDRFWVQTWGYESFGIDLFPPIFINQDTHGFHVGDIAEPLTFPDYYFTYATCHAMISLLKPKERIDFYKEAYRVMKIGGKFALSGLHLKNGYDFDLNEELRKLLKNTEFQYIRSYPYGGIVQKDTD